MEQINSWEKRKLGELGWAKFLPEKNEDGSFAYWDSKLVEVNKSGRPGNRSYSVQSDDKIVFRVDKNEQIDWNYHPFPIFN